jgi:hypothetical protein
MPEPDLTVNVAATLYYLYRLAGAPLGNNHAGFQAWIESSVTSPFNALAEKESEE